MEANAPPAGSWHRRLRPPRPPVGAWESPSLSSLPPGSRYTADLGILTKMLRPFLTSALARGQRGSAINNKKLYLRQRAGPRVYSSVRSA